MSAEKDIVRIVSRLCFWVAIACSNLATGQQDIRLKDDERKVGTLLAGLDKAGFVILATRGIGRRGHREDQLDGVKLGAKRARRNINGMK